MRVIPLAAYLDRGSPTGPGSSAIAGPAISQVTREEEISQARRESEKLGREAARLEHEEELRNERERFETRLAEERQAWAREQGGELAKGIEAGFTRIEAAIAEVTARLLEPVIIEEARRTALADLRETLGGLLADPDTARLKIEGPGDLLVALREGLGSKDNLVVFAPSDRPDIRVETGDTVIETRLGAWASRLREAMR